MAASLEFILLCLCWVGALATLLIFLETCFSLSSRNRFMARRASGAYGVISVLVPMRGSEETLQRTIHSVFAQSYPFIELFLIYPAESASLGQLARGFQTLRSHIPVRLIETSFPIVSSTDCVRALERAQGNVRGRWLVTFDPDVILDRFAIETAVELAGSNEVSALGLRPGIRCRSFLEKWIGPALEHFVQAMRTARRRHHQQTATSESNASFLLVNREAFDGINRMNRMPGILNDTGWNIWNYQVEGLRTFEADGSRWVWKDFDAQSLRIPLPFVIGSTALAVIGVTGVVYGLIHGMDGFAGVSILAFSAVTYLLMALSYFLFARKLHGTTWCAPLWFVPHLAAAVLTAFHPLERPRGHARAAQPIEIVKDAKGRRESHRS
jgi:hypothetical protein